MKKKYVSILFLAFILFASMISSDKSVKVMKNIFNHNRLQKADAEKIVIVIDPGHGGRDPGKVGINNVLEKDINLSISLKLKKLLEQNDIKVVMTREDDQGLYSASDTYKKRADMNHRVEMIRSSKADLAVSIHQNSFPEEYVKGAQVFYYTHSEEGKQMAEIIQDQVKKTINDGNHRVAKSNSNYFMLKQPDCPIVIVECGYVTNQKEAILLQNEEYQEKMAWGIHLGIMQYINQMGIKK